MPVDIVHNFFCEKLMPFRDRAMSITFFLFIG